MSYDWYRDSASTNSSAQVPVLRLYVQDPANPSTQGYMVFEPIYNDHTLDLATLTNQWVSENVFALDGHMWGSGTLPATPQSSAARTLSQWISSYGTYNVLALNAGFGSGWGEFSGAVDNLAVGFGGSTTDYTFSVVPEPSSLILAGLGAAALLAVARRRLVRRRMA